ncbi:MAG: TetR/AcrR family transcriptional regulator [Pleurocapsa sp.]
MTKMDKIPERTKSETKTAAILKGAMKEFLKNGYAATSMDKVAKSAGVSKATVYSHFGDKEKLFNALIQDLVKDKFQTVMGLEQPQSLEQDPKIVLSAIMSKMLDNAQSDRSFRDFMRIIIGESGRFPELAKAYVANVAKPTIEILTKYLKSHPTLKLEDPEATVRVMMGTMVYFVMLQEMMHGKDVVPLEGDRVIQTLTDLITRN